MEVRLNVPIDDELRKRFRIACLEDGRTMTEVVRELVEQRLAKREKASKEEVRV